MELAGKLASRHCDGKPLTASRLMNGAFNICYRVAFANGYRVVVRFTALGRVSNIPHNISSRERFDNAADYFEKLARHQLYHLRLQRNDTITNEADCRKKYITRCLFRKLSRQVSEEHCSGPFQLYCNDLRPCNILVMHRGLSLLGWLIGSSSMLPPFNSQ
ncbi:unnamed protein product [Penicillium roqueforti FM164]|uniref:Genomic scaffold, ProqFM164S03 n=1 Tax=Penicillium roqueforti (strain FM164) TaxID=1365484 RepID=W6QB20_PENRF|nr:unnamed protein product [Penicillium roqueforti FM164]